MATDWIKEYAVSIKRLATQDPITLDALTTIWKYADAIERSRVAETEEFPFPEMPCAAAEDRLTYDRRA